MKVQTIARSGLLCALYGVLLLLNTLFGLWIETSMPFVFALPILMAALLYLPKQSAMAMSAMLLMTLILSSITTWLLAGSMVFCGWLFGAFVQKKWPLFRCFWISTLIFTGINYLSMSVLAGLFGFSGEEEKALFAWVAPVLSWNGFLWLVSLILSVSQALVLLCLVILLWNKSPFFKNRPRLYLSLSVPDWLVFSVPLTSLALILIYSRVLSCPSEARDVLLIAGFLQYCLLLWRGMLQWLSLAGAKRRLSRWQILGMEVLTLIPVLNLPVALLGWREVWRHGQANRKVAHEPIS